MTTLHNPDPRTVQLIALRGAIRLEIAGMTRRGRSATAIAKHLLGLPKSLSRQATLDAVTQQLNEALPGATPPPLSKLS